MIIIENIITYLHLGDEVRGDAGGLSPSTTEGG